MPSSAVHTFTGPDAYHANIRRAQVVQGVVITRGEYRSELMRTDLHRLWMQRGDENLARVLNFAPAGERVPILCHRSTSGSNVLQRPGTVARRDHRHRVRCGKPPSIVGGLSMRCHIPDPEGSRCCRASDHRSRVDRYTFYLSNQTAS